MFVRNQPCVEIDYATACDCIRLYAVVAVVCDLYIINDNDSDIDMIYAYMLLVILVTWRIE